jgi:hypothetical protein
MNFNEINFRFLSVIELINYVLWKLALHSFYPALKDINKPYKVTRHPKLSVRYGDSFPFVFKRFDDILYDRRSTKPTNFCDYSSVKLELARWRRGEM